MRLVGHVEDCKKFFQELRDFDLKKNAIIWMLKKEFMNNFDLTD
jgi:hypothetical protein